MQQNDILYSEPVPVDGFGPGFFRIGGQVIRGDILVLPTRACVWAGFDDVAPLIDAADDIDVFLVGMGAEIAHLPKPFRAALEAVELAAEPMTSASACRLYNILVSEGRRVGLALLAV